MDAVLFDADGITCSGEAERRYNAGGARRRVGRIEVAALRGCEAGGVGLYHDLVVVEHHVSLGVVDVDAAAHRERDRGRKPGCVQELERFPVFHECLIPGERLVIGVGCKDAGISGKDGLCDRRSVVFREVLPCALVLVDEAEQERLLHLLIREGLVDKP
ncbi:MAG: hypothetical protein BWX50_00926 [Euryarchaeota archaeon ADurb.Bin009]|nr:MAG: hypothetical protein BWX50_00926 [Euryarchaeota archaeon ADurb.Bin009]